MFTGNWLLKNTSRDLSRSTVSHMELGNIESHAKPQRTQRKIIDEIKKSLLSHFQNVFPPQAEPDPVRTVRLKIDQKGAF